MWSLRDRIYGRRENTRGVTLAQNRAEWKQKNKKQTKREMKKISAKNWNSLVLWYRTKKKNKKLTVDRKRESEEKNVECFCGFHLSLYINTNLIYFIHGPPIAMNFYQPNGKDTKMTHNVIHYNFIQIILTEISF